MGLDITAYSRLKHIGKHVIDPSMGCEDENHLQAFTYDSFPQSFRGIPVLGTMRAVGGDTFIDGGCYEPTGATEEHHFRAGSYGGYGRWREDLARQFNPVPLPDLPFYELIWFADNEGSIGPDAAKDLLTDFRDHAERYAGDEYSRQKYKDWCRAFELAADGGLVEFA